MAMSSLPTPYPYAPPVSTHLKISSPPSPSDPTTLSNGKPAAESQSAETEKQDDSPAQADKSEVQDSSPPSHSDSTTLSNGKPDAENPSPETEKQDDHPGQPDSSEVQDSSDKST